MSTWRGRGVTSKPPTPQIRRGDIVFAPIVPDRGTIKPRRSVVISTEAEIRGGGRIWVVGVTASYDPNDPDLFIPMPHSADGRCSTTFTVPCAAKATWVQAFPLATLRSAGGFLARPQFDELLRRLEAFRQKRLPKNPPRP